MHRLRFVGTAALGAVVATAILLSCSDDSPGDADAAVCDCPAAEPPLAGRITQVVGETVTISAMGGGTATALCPTGAIALGGGCEQVPVVSGVTVIDALLLPVPGPGGFACQWVSTNALASQARAMVTCLMPAEQ